MYKAETRESREAKDEDDSSEYSSKALQALLGPYLYQGVEHDIALITQHFPLIEILNLALILTPGIVKDYLVIESSPLAHKVLIELLCSATHESFVKLIELVVTKAKPEDEIELFERLRNVYKTSSK